jgi:hypothetical protein
MVTVTASQTCRAVAYNSQELREKATQLLTSQAGNKLGAGYSLLGESQVTVTQITITHTTPMLTFSSQASFVYGFSKRSQEHIKSLIKGKTIQEAMQLLTSFKGIKSVSMQWDENTKLPKNLTNIHIVLITDV